MPIPDFQTVMLPLLKLTADQKEHSTSDYIETLADQFKLTGEEKSLKPPHANQGVFANRVFWAKANLNMAGLIEDSRDGFFKITDRGLKTLSEKPDKLDVQYLKRLGYLNNGGQPDRYLQPWIEQYKQLLKDELPGLRYNEVYKWESIQHFQDNWTDNHNAENILSILKKSFNRENNNLWSGRNYLPYTMLLEFARDYPQEVSEMFSILYDENRNLADRIDAFLDRSEGLLNKVHPGKDLSHYQSKRALMVYLTLRFPDKYYLFKNSMFNKFCEITGIREKPGRSKERDYSILTEYFQLCDQIRQILTTDRELLELHSRRLPPTVKFKDNYHTLTQDFIYCVTTYLTKAGVRKYTIEEMAQLFKEYIERIKPDSARNYLSAIPTINRILVNLKLVERTIYEIQDAIGLTDAVEELEIDSEYKERNQAGHNMFSVAIKHYKDFLNELSEPGTGKSDSDGSVAPKNINALKSLNLIFFGPAGTGKTYRLQRLTRHFILTKTVQTREEHLGELIANLTWWETIAAAMTVLKKTTVPELEKHEFIKIKTKQSGAKNVKQLLWNSLQTHTDPVYSNVQVSRRIEPFIFKKEDNSVWTVLEDAVKEDAPEVVDFLNAVKNFKPATGSIQKNYRMVTFHQGFSYEDFVEGIKPVMDEELGDELRYEIKEGIFYQACDEAAKLAGYNNLVECIDDDRENRKTKIASARPYALFIDEINRANVSSVFGELITLIEEDKRLGGENEITDTILPYSKTRFGIPGNLYLIGTMNTADRSVEALDTALRRRFAFDEMMPKPSILNNYSLLKQLWIKYKHTYEGDKEWEIAESKFANLVGMLFTDKNKYIDLKPHLDDVEDYLYKLNPDDFKVAVEFNNGLSLESLLSKINERLIALLSRDHTIGHAWLMDVFCFEDLQNAFSNKILPLLKEFFYNDYAKIGLVLGKKFVESKVVGQKTFAGFDEGNELASEYADKIIYSIKDPLELSIDDFKSIYE